MGDTSRPKLVAKRSQTFISQFFPRVDPAEARAANAQPYQGQAPVVRPPDPILGQAPQNRCVKSGGKRFTRNLTIFQLNTAKKPVSGTALARLMGDCVHSLAFVTEPPFYNGKLCGFPSMAFTSLYDFGSKKRCRAAIVASKEVPNISQLSR